MSIKQRYLGDGVYVSFDGFHVWVSVNQHDNDPVVALDHQVQEAMLNYLTEIKNR